jgi:hypothetical protein
MSMFRKLIVPAAIASCSILGLTGCSSTTSNGAGTTAPAAPASGTAMAAHSAATPVSAQSGSSAAPQQTLVSAVIDDCSGKPVPQPGEMVLTCADAGWVLDHLTWTDWGRPTASATGEWSEKNCKPNCATGGISEYPVTVTVSSLHGTAYTRMSISAPTSPTPKAEFSLSSTGPKFMTAK